VSHSEFVSTPFSLLKNAKAYCSQCKNNSTDDIRVIWNPAKIGKELFIDGIFISRNLLASGLINLENKIMMTIQKLFYDLPMSKYLQNVIKILNQEEITNQFSYDSILDFPSVRQLSATFIEDLSQSQQFQQDFLNHGLLSAGCMKKFLLRSTKLGQLLLTALHLSSGLPSRGTELETLKFRKSGLALNNVWILNGRLVTITYYNKTATSLDDGRPIVRVLPQKISGLLLLYLLSIRQIERLVVICIEKVSLCIMNINSSEETRSGSGENALFIYNGLPISDRQIRNSFAFVMSTSFNLKISFSQYRHVANAFANTLDISKLSSAAKLIIAEQTGHSQATADSTYGLSAEKLRMLDSTSMNLFFQVSLLWHEWLGITDSTSEEKSQVNEEKQTPPSQLAGIQKRIEFLETTVNSIKKGEITTDVCSKLILTNFK
jgi:hypothetical protein